MRIKSAGCHQIPRSTSSDLDPHCTGIFYFFFLFFYCSVLHALLFHANCHIAYFLRKIGYRLTEISCPNNWHDTTLRHIILTPCRPLLVSSAEHEVKEQLASTNSFLSFFFFFFFFFFVWLGLESNSRTSRPQSGRSTIWVTAPVEYTFVVVFEIFKLIDWSMLLLPLLLLLLVLFLKVRKAE